MGLAIAGVAVAADPVAEFSAPDELLILEPSDFLEAEPRFGPDGAAIAFALTPEMSTAFADLTERAVGQVLTLKVCGDTLVEATVRERISGTGFVALDSLGSAVWYSKRMRGDAPCGPGR